jgi:hypothetical protein
MVSGTTIRTEPSAAEFEDTVICGRVGGSAV